MNGKRDDGVRDAAVVREDPAGVVVVVVAVADMSMTRSTRLAFPCFAHKTRNV